MTPPADPNQVCILWHPADSPPADSLIRALTKRGLSVMPAASIHTVFASACRCSKTAKRAVIVLDGRESLSGVDRVLDGLERFSPAVICWEHQPGANPPMVPVVRAVAIEVQSEPKSTESDPVVGRKSAGSKLRLVGEDDLKDRKPKVSIPTTPSNGGGTISSMDVLNADELDALLAGELGDEPRGKK